MKTIVAVAFAVSLALPGSFALAQPSGGPAAKGNAPLKPAHTINDGTAKRGASSFTEGQARQHILNSGYQGVSGLAKGDDGVWRGTAMRDGTGHNVALDFKGNVSELGAGMGPAGGGGMSPAGQGMAEPPMNGAATSGVASEGHAMRHRHHRHHRRHHRGCSTHPGPNGAACSGIDRNRNGVSDKEDRAHR